MTGTHARLAALACLAVAGGCSEDEPGDRGTPDAGTPDGGGDAGDHRYQPALPAPPEPPRLPSCLQGDDPPGCAALPALADWPCPEGWEAAPAFVDEEGRENPPEGMEQTSICVPPDPPRECPEGTMPWVSEAGCWRIGDACPETVFPSGPAQQSGARIWVLAGAQNGDGTEAAPLGSLAEAVAAAGEGGVVIVGPGTYAEAVRLPHDVTLWGTCVGKTVLEAPGPYAGETAAALVIPAGVRAFAHNLRITGEQAGVLVEGGEAALWGVEIRGAVGHGVRATSGSAELRGCLIRETRLDPEDTAGRGLFADGGASVTVQLSAIERSHRGQVVASGRGPDGPTELLLEDVVLRDGVGGGDGSHGWGVVVDDGATARVRRALLERHWLFSVRSLGSAPGLAPRVDLEDVVVRDTLAEPPLESGVGVAVVVTEGGSARVVAWRLLVERSGNAGLVADGEAREGAVQVSVSDLVVRDVGRESPTYPGMGVWVYAGAGVTLERALLDRCRDAALSVNAVASGVAATLAATDVVARDTRLVADDEGSGNGLAALYGADVELRRALFERNRAMSVAVYGIDGHRTRLDAEDLVVRRTACEDEDSVVFGVSVAANAEARLERATITEVGFAGLVVSEAAGVGGVTVQARDLLIGEPRGEEVERPGMGIVIAEGATLSIERAVLLRMRDSAIWIGSTAGAALPPGEVTLTDLVVAETRSVEGEANGGGLVAHAGGAVRVERARFAGNTFVGLYAEGTDSGRQTELVLADVEVLDTRVADTGAGGFGIDALAGAHLHLVRGRLAGNGAAGLVVDGAEAKERPRLRLEDVAISDTLGSGDRRYGYGLSVQAGVDADLRRVRIERSRQTGLFVSGGQHAESASLVAEDVAILDTAFAVCAGLPPDDPDSCVEGARHYGAGHGLSAITEADVTLDGFLVTGSAGSGLVAATGSVLSLHRGAITDNGTGITLLSTAVEPSDLADEVYVYGNGVDLSRAEVPLPTPATAIGDFESRVPVP